MRLIELEAGSNAEADAMRAMFIARKEVFVDLLKWDIPVLDGRFEVDHFDTQDARYLIVLGDDGRHRASARLLPTAAPHILDTLFAALCDEPVPVGPSTMEITRFCLDRHQRASERLVARNTLVAGLVDYAIANGVDRYTGVAEIAWYNQVRRFGWQCRALGQPRRLGGETLIALCISIDDGTIPGMTAAGLRHPEEGRTDHQLVQAVA